MNPIELFKAMYLHGGNGFVVTLFLQAMLGCMLWMMTKRSLFGNDIGRMDRYWSGVCGTLINRIERLMPEYEATMLYYAKFTQKGMRPRSLLDLARRIPKDVKLQAERDLCLHDLKDSRTVTSLRMQFASLLSQHTTHTTGGSHG